jgi:hypothetical protein
MMRSALLASALALAAVSAPSRAADPTCKLKFNLEGWSAIYKTAEGTGTVTCDNGKSLPVKVSTKGVGLTAGKSKIDNGFGQFAGVNNINDVLGTYVAAEAHAGASDSTNAQVMTKGNVSLSVAGTGKGWDLGVDLSGFTISKR